MSAVAKSWVLLAGAIVLELISTTSLKLSNGFTEPAFTTVVIVGYALCFTLFSFALRHLPLGLSYGIWGGLGTVGTAVIGMLAFGETLTALTGLGMALVIGGVALMSAGERQPGDRTDAAGAACEAGDGGPA
ncbi:multidrug efflux SMR transporter [Berryella wangjianweii]|uniref:Multidrug efflux SMR transporter n=1 Tax=Berryella wangjianweii TaxID=2734634 RepID=A0A6M8J294_9ACTN|nr:multidrug efflux SMR transporter [Berryella wangjianweii]QKF07697.1 multidrug efflux SMR transporter [Berryella wangjianweii]